MTNVMETLVPITLFLVAGGVAVTAMILRIQKRKIESNEILAAIEKGVEVKFPDTTKSRLLTGLIWLFFGIIMTIGMAVAVPPDAPSGMVVWGLIPAAVGAAYLIVYRIESKAAEENKD